MYRLDESVLLEKLLSDSIFEKKRNYKRWGIIVNLWKDSALRLLPKFLLS